MTSTLPERDETSTIRSSVPSRNPRSRTTALLPPRQWPSWALDIVMGRDGKKRSPIWVELLFIAWLCWIYDMLANLAPVRAVQAHRDAGYLLHFEKIVHLDPEAALDHWLAPKHTLALWLSNYYDNAHFAVTLGLVGIVWTWWPHVYRPLRNGLVLTNLMAMVVFWLFPTAPPRLFDPKVYTDVVAATGAFGSWHSGTLAHAADQFAAMPSLHLGWACWSSVALWRILPRSRWRLLVWVYPLVTAVAVMATGNHYLLDVLAGIATLALAMVIADRWQVWWGTRQVRPSLHQPLELAPSAPAGPATSVEGASDRDQDGTKEAWQLGAARDRAGPDVHP